MMRVTILCCAVVLTVLLVQTSEALPAYQVLPPREGYVPVYIRYGETPLDEINPSLAAAFHEYGISARKIKSGLDDQMMGDQPQTNSNTSEESNDTSEEKQPTKPSSTAEPTAAEVVDEVKPQALDAAEEAKV
uniref:Putative conserved secreted protein n=1 Tax=Lutzomyia longipalpis TaxID=7200 RepID=A0A1B0CQ66_LUTLO